MGRAGWALVLVMGCADPEPPAWDGTARLSYCGVAARPFGWPTVEEIDRIVLANGGLRGPGPARGVREGMFLAALVQAADRDAPAGPGGERAVASRDPWSSTFPAHVGTASWHRVRRALGAGVLPDPSDVRVEELVSYVDLVERRPTGGPPVAVRAEYAPDPLRAGRHVLRITVDAVAPPRKRAPVHLTVILDTSESMARSGALPLAQGAVEWLVGELEPADTVGVCAWDASGAARLLLAPLPAAKLGAFRKLVGPGPTGGSDVAGSGLDCADAIAGQAAVRGHTSRMVVLTDGGAGLDPAPHDAVLARMAARARQGLPLAVVSVRSDGFNRAYLEQQAGAGGGGYFEVDDPDALRRVLADDVAGLRSPALHDVSVEVELDPADVLEWRLHGYEAAGRSGSHAPTPRFRRGDRVTALYDVALRGPVEGALATVRVRAGGPGGPRVWTTTVDVSERASSLERASPAMRLAWTAATLADVLRADPAAGAVDLDAVSGIALRAARRDHPEDREIAELVLRAAPLVRSRATGVTGARAGTR